AGGATRLSLVAPLSDFSSYSSSLFACFDCFRRRVLNFPFQDRRVGTRRRRRAKDRINEWIDEEGEEPSTSIDPRGGKHVVHQFPAADRRQREFFVERDGPFVPVQFPALPRGEVDLNGVFVGPDVAVATEDRVLQVYFGWQTKRRTFFEDQVFGAQFDIRQQPFSRACEFNGGGDAGEPFVDLFVEPFLDFIGPPFRSDDAEQTPWNWLRGCRKGVPILAPVEFDFRAATVVTALERHRV